MEAIIKNDCENNFGTLSSIAQAKTYFQEMKIILKKKPGLHSGKTQKCLNTT